MRKYSSLVTYIIQLRDGPMHEQVMDAVSDFISDGYTEKSAVRMAVKKYRHLLEEYLVDDDEDETTDTNDNESIDADNEDDSDNIDDNELTDADNEDDSNNIALM